MVISEGVVKWFWKRVQRTPEAFIVSLAVIALATAFVLPHLFGAKVDVDRNTQNSKVNHKLVVKALCQTAEINLSGQEQSIQNEIYSLEQALYQVERYVEEGTATSRDRSRRDQLKIQLQRLNYELRKVQSKEEYIPACHSNTTSAGGSGGIGGGQ